LGASQIVVEHRYFGESWPEPRDWQYLTVENAAGDHHQVTALLKPWFSGKWVNTGISKGGQTALLHRMYYPGDVDLTVSYVAPMNFGVEDGRHEPWIAKVSGDRESRRKVRDFQLELLRRRDRLMPLFEQLIREKKYTFRAETEDIYDFTVLEYSFSFWQWGRNPDDIPSLTASDEEIFNYWIKACSPDYFSLEELERMGSFFIQAARQLGYYGYDTRPFRKYLKIKTARNYLAQLFLPEGYRPAFDRSPALKTQRFLNTTHVPMIFIYGKNDPWSASGVVVPRKSSLLKVVQEGGSHSTRIATLDEANKKAVLEKMGEIVPAAVPVMAE
ncbi:MAG TPA: S28 family serine protease, partial [Prolixibacteraceae bacterium]|nr:S28 family serine protease [Prolixibacteraceae bacterium]